jgi:hypothetical protein
MSKTFSERVADFVDRWSVENAGRYELSLIDGQRIVIHDCHLSRDLANRPDHIWVNHDSAGQTRTDCDIDDVVSIRDLEQNFAVLERQPTSNR